MHICIYGLILLFILIPSLVYFIYKYRRRGRIYGNGCDRGFGFHIAKQLDKLGFRVIAGCLNIKGKGAIELQETSNRIHTLQLDVTKDEDVYNAVRYVECSENKELWGIINNAGLAVFAECEWCPLNTYENIIDVNLTGLIRVTKAFLPYVRKSQGRVVNIASLAGRCGLPGFSAYSASKFGVIGFSECIRREMSKFKVKVITIEPALYKTPLSEEIFHVTQNETMWRDCSETVKDSYGIEYFQDFIKRLRKRISYANSDIGPVIDSIEDAICCRFPNSRYVPELYYSLASDIFALFPYSIQDIAVATVMDN